MVCMRWRAAAGAAVLLWCADAACRSGLAVAQTCRALVFYFQPVPYDSAHELPGSSSSLGVFEENGPQVAIWLETVPQGGVPPAQRGSFVAHAFVRAGTATCGIGNRPGAWNFVSSPRFPYGPRDNVLPVWAWARGHDYPALVMQDGVDESFGFHEAYSTSENFFCRPMQPTEIVDALTCPSPLFNSDNGLFETRPLRS